MRKIVNPKQIQLFDRFDSVLTPKTRKRLLDGWPGVFRHIILELMPVDAVSEHFDPAMGRPTKELYSVAGLLLIQEFMDWTKDETLDAYSFNMNVHYALNLEPVAHDISKRTLERYINLFEQDNLADISHLSVHKRLFYPFDSNNYTKFNLNYQDFSFLRQLSCGFIRKTRFVGPRLLEIPASVQTLTAIVFIKSSFSAILIISHTQLV